MSFLLGGSVCHRSRDGHGRRDPNLLVFRGSGRLDDRRRRGVEDIHHLRGRLLRGQACLRPWFRGSLPFPWTFRLLSPCLCLLRHCRSRSGGGVGRDDGIRGGEIVDRGRARRRGRTIRSSQSRRPRDLDLALGDRGEEVRGEDHEVGEEDGEDEEDEEVRDANCRRRRRRRRPREMRLRTEEEEDYDGLPRYQGGFGQSLG